MKSEVVAAISAAGPGKAVSKDAAVEVATKYPLGNTWDTAAAAVIEQRKPGCQMVLHCAVEQRALRTPLAIGGRRSWRDWGGGGLVYLDRGPYRKNIFLLAFSVAAASSISL